MVEAKAPEPLAPLCPSLVDRDPGRHIDERCPSFALFIRPSQASNVMRKSRTRVNGARMTITGVCSRARKRPYHAPLTIRWRPIITGRRSNYAFSRFAFPRRHGHYYATTLLIGRLTPQGFLTHLSSSATRCACV